MINQRHKNKTRAMIDDDLQAHHEKLFLIDMSCWFGILCIVCLLTLALIERYFI